MGSAFSLDGKISIDSRDFVKGAKQASVAIGDVNDAVEEVPDKLDLDTSGVVSGAGKAETAVADLDATTKAVDDKIGLDTSDYVAGADRAEKQIDQLDAATKSTDDSIDIDSTGFVKGVDKASDAIDGLEDDMDDLEGSAKESGGNAGSALGDAMSSKFAAVGVGAVIATSLNEAMNIEAGLDRVTAQFALTAEEAKEYGELGGDLYAAAWGDSIETTTRVIAEVGRSLQDVGSIADDELGSIGERVIAVADTFDQDFNAIIRSTGQLLRNDLADDADHALDLITVGFQEGGDRAEDLLDTIDEYAQHWSKLGIDGDEALGIIIEGFRQGFRDGDKLADLFKEFGLRALEDDAISAFDALGLVGTSMQTAFGEGGAAARAALGDTISALADIEDPIEQNRIAIKLFGTQWEDLGPRAIDALETIEVGLGEVEGAAQDVADTVADNTQASFEELKRQGMEMLTDLAGGFLSLTDAAEAFADGDYSGSTDDLKSSWDSFADIPIISQTVAFWDKGPGQLVALLNHDVDEFESAFERFGGAVTDVTPPMHALEEQTLITSAVTDAFAETEEEAAEATAVYGETVDDLIASLDILFDTTDDLIGIENDAEAATYDMNDAIADFTEVSGDAEVGTREYNEALASAEEAVIDQAHAQADLEIAQRLANGEVLTAQEEQDIYKGKLEATAAMLDGPVKESIDGHIATLDSVPTRKVTEIMAELDVSRAEATFIYWSNLPRSMKIDTYISHPAIDDQYRASGGPVTAGEPYIVGERGLEIFVPDQSGTIIPNESIAVTSNAVSAAAAPTMQTATPNTADGNTAPLPSTVIFNGPVDDSAMVVRQIDTMMWKAGAR